MLSKQNDRPSSMIDLFITLPLHYIECLPYTLAQIDKPTMSLNLLEHKLDSNELVIPLSIVSLENYLHCEPWCSLYASLICTTRGIFFTPRKKRWDLYGTIGIDLRYICKFSLSGRPSKLSWLWLFRCLLPINPCFFLTYICQINLRLTFSIAYV